MSDWVVRDERQGESEAIRALIGAAFLEAPHSNGAEGTIPRRLRDSGHLALSLVAEAQGELIGYAAFSPIVISDETERWYGLGPVAVIPSRQGEGIGSALIREGIARLRDLNAQGCVVLGEPEYYRRFGFRHDPALTYPGPPPRYFTRLVLAGPEPAGEVGYAPAFG